MKSQTRMSKRQRTTTRTRRMMYISSSVLHLLVAILSAPSSSSHCSVCFCASFIALDTVRHRLAEHVLSSRTSRIASQRHGYSKSMFLESTKHQNARVDSSDSSSNNAMDWKNDLSMMMNVDISKLTPNDAAAALRQVASAVARIDVKKNDAHKEEEGGKEEEATKESTRGMLVKLISIIEKSLFQNQKSQQQQGKNSLSMYALVDTLVAMAILKDQDKKNNIIIIINSQPLLQQQQQQQRYDRLARAVWMQLSSRVDVVVTVPPALQQQFPLGPRLSLDCLCAAHTLQLTSSSSLSTTSKILPYNDDLSMNDSSSCLYTALCQRLTQGDALSRLSSANLVKCLQSTLASSLLSRHKTNPPTRIINDDADSLSLLQPAAKDSNNNTTTPVRNSGSSSSSKAELLLLRALARRFRKGSVHQAMSNHLLLQRVIPCLVMFLERANENDNAVGVVVDKSHGDVNLVWEMQRLTFTLVKDLIVRLSNTAGEPSTSSIMGSKNETDNNDGQEQVITARDLAWLVRGCSVVTVGESSNNNLNEGKVPASCSSLDMVHQCVGLLHQYQNDGVLWKETVTLHDVDVILQSLQTWKRRTTGGDDDEFATIVQNFGTILVDRLEQQHQSSLETTEVDEQQHVNIDKIYPINQQRHRIVTSILRNAVLMYRHDPVVMKDFIRAWEMMLILMNDRNNAFWTQGKISDVANWVWFAYMSRCCSNNSLMLFNESNNPRSQQQQYIVRLACLSRLGRLILQPEMITNCTPKLACRILCSYTAIVSLLPSSTSFSFPRENNEFYSNLAKDYKAKEAELREILHSMFTRLGEYLLSQRLSPLDVTRAIVAYAKAPYVEDMGIFDHLVEVLVTKHLYPEPHQHDQKAPPPTPPLPVRSVAQCLWACGKMATWDEQHQDNSMTTLLDVEINRNDVDAMRPILEPPPYIGGARDMAYFVMDHCDELSSKDTAQALWALAHLQIPDATAIVETLVQRIKTVGPHMTAQEVANTLWALSKLRSNTFDAVFILSQRVVNLINDHNDNNSIDHLFKPPEAASILYALGRLHIRQEEIFDKLSGIILQQIDATTALTVSHVLWAHRAVYILPPQALLDTWAKKKLGLQAIADEQQPRDYYHSSW